MVNKTYSIQFHEIGAPEVLTYRQIDIPELGDDQVRIRHKAIGVNFVDTYFRSGLYPTELPSGLGTEAAGVVEAVGKNVNYFKVNDRVAYAQGPLGAYSETRVISENFVVKIPDTVSFEAAASSMLKGLTVYYLFKDIYKITKNEIFLFHAAAGGVGLIATQWANHIGAKLIGTVSSEEKSKRVKDFGAWETINYSKHDVAVEVKKLTSGKLVPVVYDGVGKSTWEASLNCLKPKGLMVSFGNASGPVTGVNLSILSQKGSLFVTRPTLVHYMDSVEKLRSASAELFNLIGSGLIKIEDLKTYPLSEAASAHQNLLDRNRMGGLILIP